MKLSDELYKKYIDGDDTYYLEPLIEKAKALEDRVEELEGEERKRWFIVTAVNGEVAAVVPTEGTAIVSTGFILTEMYKDPNFLVEGRKLLFQAHEDLTSP